jgi:hypothetical protein
MAQIKKTPYTKTGDVLTFKFRVPGFSQDAINALALELLVQLEGSDDHPTAYLVEPPADDAHLFTEREAFVEEQQADEDEDESDDKANGALVVALAALPRYNGWMIAWEYPGYVAFHRNGSPSVIATPDYHVTGMISVEVTTTDDGHTEPRPNVAWPREGRTPEGYMAVMRPVLDGIASPLVESDEIFEDVMRAMQQAEELGGPEGAQYVALMERIAHEAQRRANTMRDTLAGTDEKILTTQPTA